MEKDEEVKIEDGKENEAKLPVSIKFLKKMGVQEKYANPVLVVVAVILYATLALLLYSQFK